MNPSAVIVTCEHASAAVPEEFAASFVKDPAVLRSHRAYDPGAADTAHELARRIGCASPAMGHFTRLLIDLNRSLHNPRVFSEFSPSPEDSRQASLVEVYKRYRTGVAAKVADLLNQHATAVHFSVHTFTPWLNGKQRQAEIGLLFDPARSAERAICRSIRRHLLANHAFRVRFNYPYRGVSDGFTRTLREEMGDRYVGIELELNHGSYFEEPERWRFMSESLISATVLALTEAAATESDG